MKDVIEIDGVKYKRVEEEKPRGMYLEVDDDDYMHIIYKGRTIGLITSYGKCNILNDTNKISAYEQWREDGMYIDTAPVEWRGGTYCLGDSYELKNVDILKGDIYNFEYCRAISDCHDDNIVRFKHDNIPVFF